MWFANTSLIKSDNLFNLIRFHGRIIGRTRYASRINVYRWLALPSMGGGGGGSAEYSYIFWDVSNIYIIKSIKMVCK